MCSSSSGARPRRAHEVTGAIDVEAAAEVDVLLRAGLAARGQVRVVRPDPARRARPEDRAPRPDAVDALVDRGGPRARVEAGVGPPALGREREEPRRVADERAIRAADARDEIEDHAAVAPVDR